MPNQPEVIEEIIRLRKTEKVFASLKDRPSVPKELEAHYKPIIESSLVTAGWAPFHFPRGIDGIAEPWRAHILWNTQTRALSTYLSEELRLTSKEPQLTAACSALVIINWLPEKAPESLGQCETPTMVRNEEHIAATSAMVQNFLLCLTAHNIGNYWSSGGQLRSPQVFAHLGIPEKERLLAAVFIEYPEMKNEVRAQTTRKPGAHRLKRSQDWIRK